MYVYTHAWYFFRLEKGVDHLELELLSALLWVLGTDLGSSVRPVHAFKH